MKIFQTASSQKGFTLLEIIVSMAVVAILTSILAPRVSNSMSSLGVDSASKQLESDIRYAQNLASTTQDIHGIQVLARNQYQIYKRVGLTKTVVTSPHNHSAMQINLSQYPGVRFSSTVAIDTTIEFDAKGRPLINSDTDILMESTQSQRTKRIRVSKDSGHIDLITN